jgi:hypothetical protein
MKASRKIKARKLLDYGLLSQDDREEMGAVSRSNMSQASPVQDVAEHFRVAGATSPRWHCRRNSLGRQTLRFPSLLSKPRRTIKERMDRFAPLLSRPMKELLESGTDVLLMPSVPGEAREGLVYTGIPVFVLLTLVSLATFSNVASAKGCVKGAAVGGVAGHVAGKHGVAGPVAGRCIIAFCDWVTRSQEACADAESCFAYPQVFFASSICSDVIM